jgi:hypothetical protein
LQLRKNPVSGYRCVRAVNPAIGLTARKNLCFPCSPGAKYPVSDVGVLGALLTGSSREQPKKLLLDRPLKLIAYVKDIKKPAFCRSLGSVQETVKTLKLTFCKD